MIDPRNTSHAEAQYRVALNAWRRGRFGQFPFLVGQRLPGGATALQSFFQTPETVIAAFHRPGRVAVGQGACLQCEGIGWLRYAGQDDVLSEYHCPVCAGTGSWPTAQRMAGSTAITYRETPRSPYAVSPDQSPAAAPHVAPSSPSRTGPAQDAGSTGRPLPARRRGAAGAVRMLVAFPVFLLLSELVAQPIYAMTRAPHFTSIVALLAGGGAAAALNQLFFGPLRGHQVLGPLWIIPALVYLLGGTIFFCSILTRWESLSRLAFQVFDLAMDARVALSRVPLGRVPLGR